jgi:hypothetical protein
MAKYTFLFIAICLSLLSCKEETVYIPPLGQTTGGNTNANLKNIFVEEFTGVKCVNCPDGAVQIEDLKAKYKERFFSVSIHAGFFAKKLPESKFDFKTPQGNSLLTYFGEPDGYPAAIINRKTLGANGNIVVVGKEQWAGLVQKESTEKAKATLDLATTFNATTRELKVTTTLTPLEALSGSHNLSVMLTESNIIDAQIVPNKGTVLDYKHKHVLRDMLTPYDGLVITEALTANAKIKKEFTYTLPATFNANECELIAVFHKVGASKEVLQVIGKKIQ